MGPITRENGKNGARAGSLLILTMLVVLGVAAPALAAPGDPDTSFGEDGDIHTLVAPDYSLYGGGASEVAVQPDGKILAAGRAKNEAGEYRLAFARYSEGGALDASFGAGGKLITDLAFVGVGGVALEPDGDIVAVGTVSKGPGDLDFILARFHADGSPDASFGAGGHVTASFAPGHEEARDIAIQPDGKIVVAGNVPGPSGGTDNFLVARFDPDGSPDTSFGADKNGDGTPDGSIETDFGNNQNWSGSESLRALALQPDGKIVVAGDTEVATQIGGSGTNDFALARYNPDGSLDPGFDGDGKVVTDLFGRTAEQGFGVALQPDGKIIAGGEYYNGSDTDYALTRYNADGSLDASFDADGKVITNFQLPHHGPSYDRVQDLAVGSRGKIVAAGSGLARYNPDGSPDASFGAEGRATQFLGSTVPDTIESIALQPDDKVVLALRHPNFHVARYHGGDDRTAPGPATALTANAQESSVSLTWNNPADADFGATRVVRRTGDYAGGPFDGTKVYEGSGTSHIDTRVRNGTHYYTAFARDASGNWAVSARASVEVHVAPPAAIIDSGPSGTIYEPSASFSFSSNEPGVSFECDLTLGPEPSGYFYPCGSPKEYTGLDDAEWTFHVRATNELGNSSVTSRTFTVDTILDTRITAGPDYFHPSEPSASFEFSADRPAEALPAVSGYECSLDDEAFGPCTSPKSYSGLTDGYHHFRVRALNAAGEPGREDSEVWRVDGTPPDIWIFLGPVDNDNTGAYNVSTATFGYSSNDPTLKGFECSLDGAPFSECPINRISYSGLADGEHTFRARGVDALGHISEVPAARTWVVDTVAPGATIASGPSGTISAGSARFEFSADEAGSTFRCKLDDEWEFTACGSPQEYSGLANGEHTLSVVAVDRAGNVGPAVSQTWTVAPETTGQQTVAANGTLTTDTENDGATRFDPLETSIKSPIGGTVSVTETAATAQPPSDYAFFGQQANITAPASTPDNPLRFEFLADSSLVPAGDDENTVQVFRNGTPIEACADQSGVAAPDPCVLGREAMADGDVKITVLTSHASYWNLGVVANVAPEIRGVSPADLARNVPATASVTATFSEAMKATTINTASFVLVKRGTTTPIGAKVSYATTKKATLNPKRDLKPGATYVARIEGGAGGAADAAGNALAEDRTWSFTVKKR